MINPWTIIGVVFFVLGAFGGGYFKGSKDTQAKQQAEIAQLNEQARTKEKALLTAVNAQANTLRKQQDEAKIQINKRNADIAAGNVKLRVAVKPTVCSVQTSGDAAPAARIDAGSAELQPEVATAILTIGDEADNTARKLATCVNLYNQVRETLKGKP